MFFGGEDGMGGWNFCSLGLTTSFGSWEGVLKYTPLQIIGLGSDEN